jgi:hypothetical protein
MFENESRRDTTLNKQIDNGPPSGRVLHHRINVLMVHIVFSRIIGFAICLPGIR